MKFLIKKADNYLSPEIEHLHEIRDILGDRKKARNIVSTWQYMHLEFTLLALGQAAIVKGIKTGF
ncbi:hypothetical protein OQJ18_01205 [Fluoribacter dumoffii]|uniref:hypothetical protein n=1 Tax=Fluoribacter dumoffii TaxID=463 RepID=UPI001E35396E|nr:hypothetical protein [Fluoribacter dumoffii]MCW8386213.1 hypothetical protein [Fluoribacter dumoffii]MCW8419264.1 hypothetical protein [Fluoribacter dumoffii]MCW8452861.1 hypothetical protein [Fluoribacter dumoffii]MCW8459889.1 hypothetical protein [Fluoribacter dumoffii]MCW8483366.1 hypothetical protein [Fluoribacter dumoffii]